MSVNERAYKLVQSLCDDPEKFNVSVKMAAGARLIDAGIKAKGSLEAGRIITEICMGGLGRARLFPQEYGNMKLLSIFVQTDHPAVATLGSQFAGWQIKEGDFFAIGSGPGRALALKPSSIYEEIKYEDKAGIAILVLETASEPPEALIDRFSSECRVPADKLYIILTPTTSIAGSTQVSGRIVETGLHKLTKLGFDPSRIMYAWGYAPIAPVHPKFSKAMGKTNDVILYGGVASYSLIHEDDDELEDLLKNAPSSASEQYGKPFSQIFKEADYDFYKIDPNLFAPAVFIVNNLKTGSVFQVGEINVEVLRQTLGLAEP